MTVGRYELTREQLDGLLAERELPRFRAAQVWHGLYTELATPAELTALPKTLRADLDAVLAPQLTPLRQSVSDDGQTVKLLSGVAGGHQVETVLMLYRDRATACVSSQAGCAMGCGFCATGQAGFDRHLTTGEIVEQTILAARRAKHAGRRLSNVVFMGMGEPLANEAALWPAVERLHGDLGLSARHLTVSTVGIIPGIRKLTARPLPVTLAVSLHAANDELRDELVPINRRYPIAELLTACQEYLDAHGRRMSFEWALIDGVNDRARDAAELAELARQLRPHAHVNLIPLNPTPGYPTVGTPPARVAQFRRQLDDRGVNATVRANRGTDIDAACGQLAARHLAETGATTPAAVAVTLQQPAPRT